MVCQQMLNLFTNNPFYLLIFAFLLLVALQDSRKMASVMKVRAK